MICVNATLVVCIVSYNTREILLDCVASLPASSPAVTVRAVVVENGESTDTLNDVRLRFPDVEVLHRPDNPGYGPSCNFALLREQYAAADYFAILNSDIIVGPECFETLISYLAAHAHAAAVSPKLLTPDQHPQMNWAAGELTVANVAWEQLFLYKLMPRSRIFGDYFRTWWAHDDTRELPQLCGAFILVRAALYREICGFDPRFFMYCEDTDLCYRLVLHQPGNVLVHVGDAVAVHYHGLSSEGALRPKMILAHNQSRYLFFKLHHGQCEAVACWAVLLVGGVLRALIWTVATIVTLRRTAFSKAAGYWDVLGVTLLLPFLRRRT